MDVSNEINPEGSMFVVPGAKHMIVMLRRME